MKYLAIIISFLILLSTVNCKDEDFPKMADYEIKHIQFLRESASECTLFLNNNEEFPIEKPCSVLLIGSGARNTLKGGLGSGDVESRYFTTCEEGLENAGFEITTKKWLDEYPKLKDSKRNEYIEYIFELSTKYNSSPIDMAEGVVFPEVEYDLEITKDMEKADIAVYVLGRNSGEGMDRRAIKGEALLTDTEIKDILYLNKKFKKFILVLNVYGVVDISPVKEVSNILLLSQLGVVTGDILADIILGKTNPSGKLATTWSTIDDYKFINDFGKLDDTRYVEGVYVGYRYFNSAGVKPLYPFGFGKSYTNFEIQLVNFINKKNDQILVKVDVKNIGKFKGKEVVQVYVSPSQENMDKPYQTLVTFRKTKVLEPEEVSFLILSFKLSEVARYDEENAYYILDKGKYIVRVGNSSENTKVFGYITLDEDVVIEQLKNIDGKPDFKDYKPEIQYKDDLTGVEEIKLTKDNFRQKTVNYNYKFKVNENVENLEDEELARICVANFREEGEVYVDRVVGEAGETTTKVEGLTKYFTMVDGPAGLRINKKYGVDENGSFRLCENLLEDYMHDFYTEEQLKEVDTLENNKDRKGEIIYQFATALPSATSLAQSFNEDFVEKCGDLVGEEMDIYNVHLWLAPALNIHRNILCGRNFEYYSEDPLISGKMAAAMTRGVQSHKNRATTIKHYACNNQEFNRKNNNSILSERALREIYLKGFRIAIEESSPIALMTSYNLINGVHSSQNKQLLIDVLRSEWGYDGLIMSDWISSYFTAYKISKHPAQNSLDNIRGGNNLHMGGDKNDFLILINALKKGELTREHLLQCASKVYETIELVNK